MGFSGERGVPQLCEQTGPARIALVLRTLRLMPEEFLRAGFARDCEREEALRWQSEQCSFPFLLFPSYTLDRKTRERSPCTGQTSSGETRRLSRFALTNSDSAQNNSFSHMLTKCQEILKTLLVSV